jgi:hypothetical protein
VQVVGGSERPARRGEPGGDAHEVLRHRGPEEQLLDALAELLPADLLARRVRRGRVVDELVDHLLELLGGEAAAEDPEQRHVVLVRHAGRVAGAEPAHHALDDAAVVAVGDDDVGRAVAGPVALGCAAGHDQPFEVKVGMTCSKLTVWPRPVAMMSVSPATTASTTTA